MIQNPLPLLRHNRWCFVFDIDSTIADNSHRAHHLENKSFTTQQKWDAFQHPDLVAQDTIYPEAQKALNALMQINQADITFLTGRHDKLHNVTFHWLSANIPEMMRCGSPGASWNVVCKPPGAPLTATWKAQWLQRHRINLAEKQSIIFVDDAEENLLAAAKTVSYLEAFKPESFWPILLKWCQSQLNHSFSFAENYLATEDLNSKPVNVIPPIVLEQLTILGRNKPDIIHDLERLFTQKLQLDDQMDQQYTRIEELQSQTQAVGDNRVIYAMTTLAEMRCASGNLYKQIKNIIHPTDTVSMTTIPNVNGDLLTQIESFLAWQKIVESGALHRSPGTYRTQEIKAGNDGS